jgi:hypothetical protein
MRAVAVEQIEQRSIAGADIDAVAGSDVSECACSTVSAAVIAARESTRNSTARRMGIRA